MDQNCTKNSAGVGRGPEGGWVWGPRGWVGVGPRGWAGVGAQRVSGGWAYGYKGVLGWDGGLFDMKLTLSV